MQLPNPGEIVAERYELQRVLGAGGMALVFEAKHLGTGMQHAIKMVQPEHAAKKDFVNAFLAEAKMAGRMGRHRHIVDVSDTGVDKRTGAPFIVMELLRGSDLRHFIQKRGRLDRAEVMRLLHQLSKALAHAHKAGVVHRDLKPGNLFIVDDDDGEIELRVLDFGISKVLSDTRQSTATAVGTPGYAAPEQFGEGLRKMASRSGVVVAKTISCATDVWAVAMLAYELLTGGNPMQYWGCKTLADLFFAISAGERVPPSQRAEVPAGFDRWFLGHTAINAAERPDNVKKAIAALSTLLDTRPVLPATMPLGPAPTTLTHASNAVPQPAAAPPTAPPAEASTVRTAPFPAPAPSGAAGVATANVIIPAAEGSVAEETKPLDEPRSFDAIRAEQPVTGAGVAAVTAQESSLLGAQRTTADSRHALDARQSTARLRWILPAALALSAITALVIVLGSDLTTTPLRLAPGSVDAAAEHAAERAATADSDPTPEPEPESTPEPEPESTSSGVADSTTKPPPRWPVPTATAIPPKSEPAPPPKPTGNVKFDENAQKNALYQKALQGRASEAELRMLKGICLNQGDRACRALAVQRLKELKNK